MSNPVIEARTGPEIVTALALAVWAKDNPGKACPADHIPTPETLAAWLLECPGAAHVEAGKRLAALYGLSDGGRYRWKLARTIMGRTWRYNGQTGKPEEVPNATGIPVGTQSVTLNAGERPGPDGLGGGSMGTLEEVHKHWLALPKEHPLAPLVQAWQERPQTPAKSTVTTVEGMTRRLATISDARRVPWTDSYDLDAAIVDGEPMMMWITDPARLFQEGRPRRTRRLFKPGEGLPLKVDGVKALPHDLRLVALEGLSPILAGDVLTLGGVVWALNQSVRITERDGAALLARTRKGGYRGPKASDVKRFWDAAAELAAMILHDPAGSGRWLPLAILEPVPGKRWLLDMKRPEWMNYRRGGERYTLTAEGGRAGKARVQAGESGAAGRLITGIEYRLAARFDGKSGTAPDLRPETKGGPGHPVFLPWRDAMALMGDSWNRTDPKADDAAQHRWRRMVASLLKAKYRIKTLRGQAEAGDSVEIVEVVRGSRARPAGLRVRASARFVEAARLANLKDGRGFETVRLTDWLPAGVKLKPNR